MLTPRRPKVHSGIERGPKREWPRHEKFIRSHCCAGCGTDRNIELAHVRTAANSGKGNRPFAWFCIPLCDKCHAAAHKRGHGTMAKEWGHPMGLDWMLALAAEFANRSPDKAMRDAMRLAGPSNTLGIRG